MTGAASGTVSRWREEVAVELAFRRRGGLMGGILPF